MGCDPGRIPTGPSPLRRPRQSATARAVDAFVVGATIEDRDLPDLAGMAEQTQDPKILVVARSHPCGSVVSGAGARNLVDGAGWLRTEKEKKAVSRGVGVVLGLRQAL